MQSLFLTQLQPMNRVIATLPHPFLWGCSLLAVGLLGLFDYLTQADVSLEALYVMPILVATWYLGRRAGWLFVGLSAIVVYGSDLAHAPSPWAPPLLWNVAVCLGVFGLISYLAGNLKAAKEVSRQLMRLDVATGAINRMFFLELLEAEFNRCERYGYPVTLACLGIGHLTETTEQVGSLAMDQLLSTLVDKFGSQLRANDVVARYTDDGFVVLLPQADASQGQLVVNRLFEDVMALQQAHLSWPLDWRMAAVTFLELPDSSPELLDYTVRRLHRLQTRPGENLDYTIQG